METRRPFRYHQPPYRGGGGAGRGSSILPGYPQPPPQGGRGPLIPTNPYGMQFPPTPRPMFMHAQLGTMGGQRPPVHYGIAPQSQFPPQIQHMPVFQPQVPPPAAMGQNPTTPQVISSSNTYSVSKGMTGGYQGQSTQPYQKTKRTNAIRIIDPNTNEEVTVKASTATDSNSSSVVTSSSSLTSVRSNVAAEFQNKVHVALNPDASSDSTPKPNAIISIPNASEGKRTSSSISLTEDTSSTKNTSAQIETKPNLSDPGKQESSTVPPSTSVEKSDGKDSVTVPLEASSSSISDSGKLTSSKSEHNTSKADSPPSGSNSKSSPVPTPSPEVVANTVPPTKDTSVQLPKDVKQVIDSPAAAEVSRNTSSVGTSSTEKQQPDQSSVTSVPAANTGEPQTKVPAIVEDGKVAREGSRDSTTTATVVTEKGQRPLQQQQQLQQPVEKTKPKEDSGRKKSKGEQDSPKNSEERKKQGEPKTAAVAAVGQSTLSLENKKSLMSEQVTTKDEYELEDGEIPPSEDKDEEVVMNGDHRQAFEAGFAPDDRKYGRNFLLEYRRLAMEPPESLRKMQDVFCPSGGGGSDYYIGGRRHKSANKKVIDHKPQAHEKVELHKAEHRWVRPVNQVIPEEEKQNQELFRKFQGILNKLTPQKFPELANKALQLDITTEERLHGCIDRIFEKALEEPNFSIAYANLCRVMSNIKVNVIRVDEEGNQVTKETSFRRELLTKCQKEFEKDKRDDEQREEKLKAIEEATNEEERKKKQVEFDEWETSVRRRSLGNIRFIGELFKLKMLSEGIMHDCIMRLLKSTSDHESLECFCRLITTTGKDLDHPQAKQRMDKYFERMAEIIDKKKISSRIKFMLQDVQDLRKCEWVPRRQEGLKTIDQIHLEAKIEAMAEQEMIKHMAVTSTKSYNRDDKKKGGKGDDSSSRKRSNLPQPPADVSKILGLRKKDGGSAPSLGPGAGLRPTGWSNKKKDGQTPPPVEKDRSSTSKTGPQKSSTGGTSGSSSSSSSTKKQSGQTTTSGRSLPGPRRSSSQPNERQGVLDALKQINQPQKKPVAPVPVDKFDENTLRRKTCTIVDEFAENKDYREAYDCVCELESPGLLGVFVAESILHTLEQSSHHREYAGRLLDHLIAKKILSKEKIMTGLKEVIEMADDLEVDIPKLWDFFAEILCPLFLSNCLSLTDYLGLLNGAEIGYKAPRSIARLLQQCALIESKEAAVTLWTDSKLSWSSVGLDDEDQQDFIEREKLQFLSEGASSFDNPAYFKDLQIMFGKLDTPNDEILKWIELQKLKKDLLFVRSLSRAAIEASTQGEGDSCILSDERFRSRLPLVKKYVDENEDYQIEVLNAMEVSMNRLKHPPEMLSFVFWSLYDVEVVSEKACIVWKEKAEGTAGKGMALQTTKKFFKWLDNADAESDLEINS